MVATMPGMPDSECSRTAISDLLWPLGGATWSLQKDLWLGVEVTVRWQDTGRGGGVFRGRSQGNKPTEVLDLHGLLPRRLCSPLPDRVQRERHRCV